MKNLNTNLKPAIEKGKNILLAVFVFGSLGAYFMHQVDGHVSAKTQNAVQAALKSVPVAQAASK
jgi:hypothetical protein